MASVESVIHSETIGFDATKIVNPTRFLNICYEHNKVKEAGDGIGVLNEKRIHLVLKDYFDPDPAHHEIPYIGYIADIKNERGIIEIQTAALNPLFQKLEAFLKNDTVTLVHPLLKKKTLSWIDPVTGDISPKHTSPKHENEFDGIAELYNIRSHVGNPNLKIRFPLLEVDEYRFRDGYARGGAKGSHRYDRIPIQLFDIISIDTAEDYKRIYIPEALTESEFTAKEYAASVHIDSKTAYYALTVLTFANVLEKCGKKGRSFLYRCII